MGVYPIWKYFLVVFVLLFSIIYSLPNIYESYPSIEVKTHDEPLTKEQMTRFTNSLKNNEITILEIKEDRDKAHYVFDNIDSQLKAYDNLSQFNDKINITLSTFSSVPEWLESLSAYPMFLGLDLKGGVHFLLQVDNDNIMKNIIRETELDIKKHLIINKFRYNFIHQGKEAVMVEFDNQRPVSKVVDSITQEFPDVIVNKEVLDGVTTLNIAPTPTAIDLDIKSALVKNLSILRTRVDELGVAQPVLQQQGKDRIIIQLPGLHDSTRAKGILGSTATLEFRLTKGTPQDWIDSQVAGKSKINSAVLYKQRNGSPTLLSRKIIVSGKDIRDANTGFDAVSNTPSVFVRLGDYGASRMLEVTSKNVGNKMAVIFVEQTKSEVINIATIREAFSKNFQITGLDLDEAQDLTILLRSGSLSAPMSIIEERTVGPSLGKYNIIAGQNSMYIGLFLVGLFMFIYYRLFGLVANIALAANIIIIVAVLSLFQATLTLSGIAGIVLTVGMAVDSNVLIFERIREELHNGNSPNASIFSGYKKAFSTIADANITTLIAAIALLTIGTGAVKGFAITLVIGILSSMFTSIVGTRAIISLIYENKNTEKISI